MEQILEVKNIQKFYGTRGQITKAIDNVSFKIEKGEFVGVMGASGSGKTTLLNCISTIDTVTTGSILIEDIDITKVKGNNLSKFRREKLGFIFQDFNLLDTLTAYENIALALSILGKNHHTINSEIEKIAVNLGITDVLNKYPYEMSGGQRQRVAAARAIMGEPALVLADEPTGALDSKSSRVLLEAFSEMNENLNSTIMMVTHDAFAASYCKRILFMRDGKIFNELFRGNDSRKDFFVRIIEVITLLGGDLNDVV